MTDYERIAKLAESGYDRGTRLDEAPADVRLLLAEVARLRELAKKYSEKLADLEGSAGYNEVATHQARLKEIEGQP